MGGRGSGGANAISIAEHLRAGTYRPHRHGQRLEAPASGRDVTPAERKRLLDGLPPEGRRVAVALLAEYSDWDAAALTVLKQYALSCARLTDLTDDDAERRREVRTNLALLKALALDEARR